MKINSFLKRAGGCFIFFLGFTLSAFSQDAKNANSSHDTLFYKKLPDYLLGRIYLSRKFSDLTLHPENGRNKLPYKSTSTLNLGVGATYDWATLNLAYGFGFLNDKRSSIGKTKYLDIQTHTYGRRVAVDAYGQYFKGYYLDDKAEVSPVYFRPDIRVFQLGFTGEYLVNWNRFSIRAAMLQSEIQQKSSGTPLIGIQIYYSHTAGDSSLIPMGSEFAGYAAPNKIAQFQVGPNAGYAYTLVLLKSVFIMGSASGRLNINYTEEKEGGTTDALWSIIPNYQVRAAAGINMPKWSIAATYVLDDISANGVNFRHQYQSGLIRLTLNYRFIAGPKLHRKLQIVPKTKAWLLNQPVSASSL